MKILITGGAGFIGCNLLRLLLNKKKYKILNIDNLSHGSNLLNISEFKNNNNYFFKKINILDKNKISSVFEDFNPDVVFHLAAESHVDRSIKDPIGFLNTNIIGTYNLLQSSIKIFKKKKVKFIHISTDEVYGDLKKNDHPFTEKNPYIPSSPYSASKAASDHLVRAWHRTYGLPINITNCSNNFGPYQYPEKLIPLTILNFLKNKKIGVYGNGKQIRDWIFVQDHINALYKVFKKGKIGETYNIGGKNEYTNLEIVTTIANIFNKTFSQKKIDYRKLINFTKDRPGHDFRYAVNFSKIKKQLGWKPNKNFYFNLEKTVNWYIKNSFWCKSFK